VRSGFCVAYDELSPEEQKRLAERPSPDFAGLEAMEEVLQ
jgi:hypothetical protein